MAKFRTPGEIDEYRPDETDPAIFRLRVPNGAEKIAWRRDIRKAGGRLHNTVALRALLRAGLEAIYAPDPVPDGHLGKIDDLAGAEAAVREAVKAKDATAPDGEDRAAADAELQDAVQGLIAAQAAVAEIESLVEGGDAAFAGAIADNLVFWEIAGLVGARMFMAGWSDVTVEAAPVAYVRGKGGAAESALAHLTPAHFAAIGSRVNELIRPTAGEAGN